MPKRIPSYESDAIDLIASQNSSTPLDDCAKKLMSSREIIARLLKAVVPEFKGHQITDILPLIGNVAISEISVDADKLPPQIINEGTEDTTVTEGTRFYDIKFTAKVPGKDESVFVIINLEIQNDYYPGYKLIDRAIYYGARLISSQYNTVFTKSDFNALQKVYTIWICTSPPEDRKNTISQYYIRKRDLLGKVKETKQEQEAYHLLNVIFVNLGDSDTKDCDGIIRMLYTLLVSDQTAQEKKDIIHQEYDVPMDVELDEEVDKMCNISSMYIERGFEKGIAQEREKAVREKKSTILELDKMGLPRDKIAQATHITINEVNRIIAEKTPYPNT